MEFEKDTRSSDEDRRLAEAKKLTLEPLHADITPEEEPEAAVVARHLTEGALANAPNDTEQSQRVIEPSGGLLGHEDHLTTVRRNRTIITVVATLVLAGTIIIAIGLSLQL